MVFFAKNAEVTQTIRRHARIVVAGRSDYVRAVTYKQFHHACAHSR